MNTLQKTIADLFELDKLPPEEAADTANRLGKLVFQAVLVRVLPTLSDEEMTEYEKVLSSPDSGAMLIKFLTEKVPNFESVMVEEAESIRQELLASGIPQ